MIGVALDENADDVRPFADGITFPVLLDRDHLLAELYAVSNVPTVIWIDADQIAKMYDGVDDDDTQLLAKLIRCFDSYHRVTTTEKDKTIRRWKLSMKLGAR